MKKELLELFKKYRSNHYADRYKYIYYTQEQEDADAEYVVEEDDWDDLIEDIIELYADF